MPPSRGHPPRAHAGPGPTCAAVLALSQPRHTAEGRTKARRAPAVCPHSCVMGHCPKAARTAGSQSPGLLGLEVWWVRQTASKDRNKCDSTGCGTGKMQGPQNSSRDILARARGGELAPGASPCCVCLTVEPSSCPPSRPAARQVAATPGASRPCQQGSQKGKCLRALLSPRGSVR